MASAPGAHACGDPFVVMAKPVGARCNLACSYCYYLDKAGLYPGRRTAMGEDVLQEYVRSYIAASPGPIVHFVWHGGEPTLAGLGLFRRAVELQQRYLPEGWRALNNLQTNGTLLDDAWCSFLAEHGFAVGISIDGPAPLHDACRRDRRDRPTHERVMRALRRLRAHGIEPDVLCTVNAHNAGHPTDVYRFFLDEHVTWLQFLPVVVRSPAGHVTAPSVDPEPFGEFLCTVFDEWVRYDVGRIAIQGFLQCVLVAGGRSADLCVMAPTCGRVPVLEHDGTVFSCDHFVDLEHRLGHVDGGLGALVDSPTQVAFGRAKARGLPAGCLTCPVLELCNGGCPKDRVLAADGDEAVNHLCAGYRRFYTHARPLVRRMAALAALGPGPQAIMGELAAEERSERARFRAAGRNDPCPCGSGAKFKHCCATSRRR